MEHEKMVKIIEELNENIPIEALEQGIAFDYATNGYAQIVRFCDFFAVYCSEEHAEEEVEKAGGMKSFIIQQTNLYTGLLIYAGLCLFK